ncbi:MAG: hypothetical protein WCP69_11225 [Bacteroidota bacterium]
MFFQFWQSSFWRFLSLHAPPTTVVSEEKAKVVIAPNLANTNNLLKTMPLTSSDNKLLSPFVGPVIGSCIASFVQEHGVKLIIKRERITKAGDYTHPHPGQPFHKITVNGNLNQYAFFITFIHEVAHLRTWNINKGRVLPHGKEWKREYYMLLKDINCALYFPQDICEVLSYHMEHIKSSSAYDIALMKVLKKYDQNSEKGHTVGDLLPNAKFLYKDRHFVRGEKLRTRIKCQCISDKRIYLFHQMATVEAISNL